MLSVNLARVRANPDAPSRTTGIDKVAAQKPVMVRPPGPMRGGLGSGLVGDTIGNHKLHGGDDQAVYAYAREDLDEWEARLGRPLGNGMFGENLTTSEVDVTEARIGERWCVGSGGLLLEVSAPRTPCRTFSAFLQLKNWIKTFTRSCETRCVSPGYLTGNGARRGRDLDRPPPRPPCDDRVGVPRAYVGPWSASALAGGRRAVNGAQGLRATSGRPEGEMTTKAFGRHCCCVITCRAGHLARMYFPRTDASCATFGR